MADISNNKTIDGSVITINNAIDNGEYELGVINRLNEISSLISTKEKDFNILSGYITGNSDANLSSMAFSDQIHEVVAKLEKIKKEMESEMTWEKFQDSVVSSATSAFNSGRENAIDRLNALLDPLTAAVAALQDSVLTKMGIPEVPVIGNIQQMFVKLADMGRIVSRLSAKEREEARKLAKKEEEEAGGSALYRLYHNSILDKILQEFIKIFEEMFNLIMKIIACIEPFLLMMLLEKLKPVIEFFGLALGEIYGIAENTYTVAKMVIFNQMKILDLLAEAIRSKIEDLWDVLRYFIHGGGLPNDAMISAVCKDIVCCDYQISANLLDIDIIGMNQDLYSKENIFKDLSAAYAIENSEDPENLPIYRAKADALSSRIKIMREKEIPDMGSKVQKFVDSRQSNFDSSYVSLVSKSLISKRKYEEKKKKESQQAQTPSQEETQLSNA